MFPPDRPLTGTLTCSGQAAQYGKGGSRPQTTEPFRLGPELAGHAAAVEAAAPAALSIVRYTTRSPTIVPQ